MAMAAHTRLIGDELVPSEGVARHRRLRRSWTCQLDIGAGTNDGLRAVESAFSNGAASIASGWPHQKRRYKNMKRVPQDIENEPTVHPHSGSRCVAAHHSAQSCGKRRAEFLSESVGARYRAVRSWRA